MQIRLAGLVLYLNGKARARPPHANKFALTIVNDYSLEVSGKDGGASGL